MMMSVDFWRRHFKPRLQKVIDAVRANQQEHVYIRYHCDGDLRPIIPDLIDMGVDILNPVQPECMPAEELIAQFKACLAFWGLVGTQTTMPFGTPREIQELVRRCAGWVEQGAAIVVSPTHVLEPEVPWENIHALVRAVRATRL
jgi:uroporphyrinogen decarboxylase